MSTIVWVLVITLMTFPNHTKIEVEFSTEQECEAARAQTHTNVTSFKVECQPQKKKHRSGGR